MFFENNTGRVYYEAHGPENGPAVIFCHGVGMNHETFANQVAALEKTYRVITWDLPYHGKSSELDHRLAFSQTAADFVIGIMDALEIKKAVLIGQSLGSFVIQRAATKHPERVIATVHLGGGSLYPGYSPMLTALRPLLSLLKLWPDASLFKMFARHKALTPDTQSYLEKSASKTGKPVIVHLTKEMLDDMATGIAACLKQPILIMYGQQDAGFVRRLSTRWHAADPASELVIIENAHHIANQDNPEAFNKALLVFLERICP